MCQRFGPGSRRRTPHKPCKPRPLLRGPAPHPPALPAALPPSPPGPAALPARRRFLAACGARLEPLVVTREMGTALLATALQLAAWLTLEASGAAGAGAGEAC